MRKILRFSVPLGLVLSLSSLGSLQAETLRQVNPASKAPASVINDPDYMNEYPWFTNDGRLFLWTRQCKSSPGPCDEHEIGTDTQWLWVSYLKNFDDLWDTPAGDTLPPVDFAEPKELHPINHHVMIQFPFDPDDPMEEEEGPTHIKALAICDKTDNQPVLGSDGLLRYRFSLYLSIGPIHGNKSLYRADRVVVAVDPTTEEIREDKIRFLGDLVPVPGTNTGKNETEPMMTRDGKYLFWASEAWGGGVAEYLGSESFGRCSQLNQSRNSYSALPQWRFPWKDQYSGSPAGNVTSRTNYHTVLEKAQGTTALVFERCHGLVPGGARDTACYGTDQDGDGRPDDKVRLWTTGFVAGGEPYRIDNCSTCAASEGIWREKWRSTHPAVAGPENTVPGQQGWLLFYMHQWKAGIQREIWYTKIGLVD